MPTSVPPLADCRYRSSFTAAKIQRNPSAGSGEPVDAIARSAERSKARPRFQARLLGQHQIGRTASERGRSRLGHRTPELGTVGIPRIAVPQDDSRTRQQPADEQVPHHPTRRAEEEVPVARTEIAL